LGSTKLSGVGSTSPRTADRPGVEPVQTARRGGLRGFLEWAAPSLTKGMLPGLIAGVIVGGLGSRLAMRVMAVTSAPAATGLKTDFGATVGEITKPGTIFLLILGAILGVGGGIAYLALRKLLPGRGWTQGLVFGLLLLALVGRLLVDPGNPDFRILSPAGLAVAMFSALPILFGLLFVPLYDRLVPAISSVRRPVLLLPAVLVGLAPLALLGGLGVLVIAGAILVWGFARSVGETTKRALRVSGSVLVVGVALWRGALFVSGIADIL
jgi:hypothetical protein